MSRTEDPNFSVPLVSLSVSNFFYNASKPKETLNSFAY